jgi:hypothetical protein
VFGWDAQSVPIGTPAPTEAGPSPRRQPIGQRLLTSSPTHARRRRRGHESLTPLKPIPIHDACRSARDSSRRLLPLHAVGDEVTSLCPPETNPSPRRLQIGQRLLTSSPTTARRRRRGHESLPTRNQSQSKAPADWPETPHVVPHHCTP